MASRWKKSRESFLGEFAIEKHGTWAEAKTRWGAEAFRLLLLCDSFGSVPAPNPGLLAFLAESLNVGFHPASRSRAFRVDMGGSFALASVKS